MKNGPCTYTVSQVARLIGLSRPRFYELLHQGVFPKPLRNPSNKRPYYDQSLFEKCKQVKFTGIDIQGRRVIFYKTRKKPKKKLTCPKDTNSLTKELYNILTDMGISCSENQFVNTVKKMFPNGLDDHDKGLVLKNLYAKLCKDTF